MTDEHWRGLMTWTNGVAKQVAQMISSDYGGEQCLVAINVGPATGKCRTIVGQALGGYGQV